MTVIKTDLSDHVRGLKTVTVGDEEGFEDEAAQKLILSYLCHQGFVNSALAFAKVCQFDQTSSRLAFQNLPIRRALSDLILKGEIESAITLTMNEFPGVAGLLNNQPPSMAFFQLICQQFVELIKHGHPDDALRYAETQLAPLANRFPAYASSLQSVIVLLAYANPAESPVSNLLSVDRRAEIAKSLNGAILGEPESKLERVLRQTITVNNLLNGFEADMAPPTSTEAKKVCMRQAVADLSAFYIQT